MDAKIFALLHSPGETMGLIEKVLKKDGLPFEVRHLYRGESVPVSGASVLGLIVMGGPMNVDEEQKYPFLKPETDLIRQTIQDQKPVLGICLGAQLIAKALGQRVYPNTQREVGWYPIERSEHALRDPLFVDMPASLEVLHWHGDTFDLPPWAVHLARTRKCENQAFRVGSNVYGLQFHFEVTSDMVTTWCESEDGKNDIRQAGESAEEIKRKTSVAYRNLEPVATRFFSSYFRRAYAQR